MRITLVRKSIDTVKKTVANMVDYQVRGNVALLGVNHPPVNAVGTAVKQGLIDGMEKAKTDRNVQAIMIYGQGRTFPAGADITEFAGMRKANLNVDSGPVDPLYFLKLIEGSTKPVVAAIHGTALGGGMEIALSTHYRVAHRSAQFGFPEVELGILPGWAGTQRFPRVAGLKVALDIIPFGRRMGTQEAESLGVIDKVVDGDIVEDGYKFAQSVIGKSLDGRITSKRNIKDAYQAQELVDAALHKAKLKKKGFMAPVFCIKAVQASLLPFEEGVQEEKRNSHILFSSGQAKAQQYAFFAERQATKWQMEGVDTSKVRATPIKTGGVVGAGTMGAGISMALLNAGIPVTLLEQNQKFLDKGIESIHKLYDGSVNLGRMSRGEADNRLSMLRGTTDYKDLADVDAVIEAIYENIEPKKEVFSKLDAVCKPEAFLFSNTSYLNIDQISKATKRRGRVMGTHFFVPAYHMKLLENVRGEETSPETVATAMALGKKIGKVPVLVGNCHGFVGNRMLQPYAMEANFMMEEGPLPWEVDEVLEDFGFPLGPLKLGDLSGLDIGYRSRQDFFKMLGLTLDENVREVAGVRYCAISDILCRQERLGRKTGSGWYRYEKPGAKQPYKDDEVQGIIVKYCEKHGLQRRQVSKQEILERCLYSLINEGFKVLEEGIAAKPQDIDTVWLLGYSWPRYTGGPLFYASEVGLGTIYDRVCHYHQQFPNVPHWEPSGLLERLAKVHTPGANIAALMAKL